LAEGRKLAEELIEKTRKKGYKQGYQAGRRDERDGKPNAFAKERSN